jgi:polysaccharide pyruvyl transferase WcaK-like protein
LAVGRLLERAAFLVSGRYHHLILGAIGGCPGVALRTTSHKVDGLCELFDGELGAPFDPSLMRPVLTSVVERCMALVGNEAARERLRALAGRLRAQLPRLGEMVAIALAGKAGAGTCAS